MKKTIKEYNYQYSVSFNYLFQEHHWSHSTKLNYHFVKCVGGIKVVAINFIVDRKGYIDLPKIDLDKFNNKIYRSLKALKIAWTKAIIKSVLPVNKFNGKQALIPKSEIINVENTELEFCN